MLETVASHLKARVKLELYANIQKLLFSWTRIDVLPVVYYLACVGVRVGGGGGGRVVPYISCISMYRPKGYSTVFSCFVLKTGRF